MADTQRLESLKRRVQQDPASIAFAALADEYRRLGLYHDAIETCRAGLQRHPAYLSARVTLGRALLEIGEYDEAQAELEQVLRAAPDNLAAIRALAEIHRKRGDSPDGYAVDAHDVQTTPAPAAAAPAPSAAATTPPEAPRVPDITPATATAPASVAEPARVETAPALAAVQPVPEPASTVAATPPAAIPLSTFDPAATPLEVVSHRATPEAAPPPAAPPPPVAPAVDPVCERLEQFLAAIDRARAESRRGDVVESH